MEVDVLRKKINGSQITKLHNFQREIYFYKRNVLLSQQQNGQHNTLSHPSMSSTDCVETKLNTHFTLVICSNTEHIPRRQEDTNGNPTHQL